MNFIVLSSSHGTTFQAVLDALSNGSLTATCLGLVADREDRACIEKAKGASLPYRVVDANPKEDREAFDRALDQAIRALGADADTVIAEMGWMWIHTPWFISQWKNRIINVHPALLPKHGGKGMYGMHVHDAVLAAAEKESGITIHLMDEGVDTGPILEQKSCSVLPHDTAETLKTKIQELEKEWYPKVLQMIQQEELKLPEN